MDSKKNISDTPIGTLIKKINHMIDLKFDLLSVIDRPQLLIEALEELDSMIEMTELKEAMVRQIQMMLVLAKKNQSCSTKKHKFDGHMLHGVIYGPPGVGKTTVAKSIGKIFYAIGVIEPVKQNSHNKLQIPDSPIPNSGMDHHNMEAIAHETAQLSAMIINLRKECQKHTNAIQLTYPFNDLISKCSYITSLCQYDDILHISDDDDDEEYPLGVVKLSSVVGFGHEKQVQTKTSPPPTAPVITLPTVEDNNIPVLVCSRSDFVAGYVGQTAEKALAFLNANIGKMLIIDEAYSLYNSDRDSFGMEALTVLIKFMEDHANDIIIYLVGYKDLMDKSIFMAQAGLRRRCENVFTIKNYTPEGLSKIFTYQLTKDGWSPDRSVNIVKFFTDKYKDFPNFGGDCLKLIYQSKQVFTSSIFESIMESNGKTEYIITKKILDQAHKLFLANRVDEPNSEVDQESNKLSNNALLMYS